MLTARTDYRIGGKPRRCLVEPEETVMKVPDEIRKCVAFLEFQSGTARHVAGTVFFVIIGTTGEEFVYAVTAKHVIEKIRKNSCDGRSYFRMNPRNGQNREAQAELHRWLYHPTDPTTDLAILEWTANEFDMLTWPIMANAAIGPQVNELKIGVGDETFTIGLFYKHHGTRRNIPIVRIGNIAAMPEEPVEIEPGVPMDAYLVEMRSTGGLSGSPVFVRPGHIWAQDGPGQEPLFLLGVMHGHWDMDKDIKDELKTNADDDALNTGIGIVVPVNKIIETINQERLVERRREEIARRQAKRLPTPD